MFSIFFLQEMNACVTSSGKNKYKPSNLKSETKLKHVKLFEAVHVIFCNFWPELPHCLSNPKSYTTPASNYIKFGRFK